MSNIQFNWDNIEDGTLAKFLEENPNKTVLVYEK